MFSIEEAKATRHTNTVNVPAGAAREFGKGTVERVIEEKADAEQAETVRGMLKVLVEAWHKLKGADAISAQPDKATR